MVMKRTYAIYIFLLLALAACQTIPESERLIPLPAASGERACLLIDFSAWQCVNCPSAAEEAHTLLEQYGDQLIVIEAHPATNGLTKPPAKYPEYDYTCPAADSLYIRFGGTNVTPLPTGVVNMKQYPDGAYFKPYQEWGTHIYSAMQSYDSVDITLTYNADEQIAYTVANYSAKAMDCTLYMYLTEDSIISAQKFPDANSTDYVRNHLLRDAILPHKGIPVSLAPETEISNTVSYTLPDKVVPAHSHIVAALYHNGEIIQTRQATVSNP